MDILLNHQGFHASVGMVGSPEKNLVRYMATHNGRKLYWDTIPNDGHRSEDVVGILETLLHLALARTTGLIATVVRKDNFLFLLLPGQEITGDVAAEIPVTEKNLQTIAKEWCTHGNIMTVLPYPGIDIKVEYEVEDPAQN